MIGVGIVRVGKLLAYFAEQWLCVDLNILLSTLVCLAYCHQSHEVCT